jgi:Protein of unknown function (DUF1360)
MTQTEYQMEQKIKLWNMVAMAVFGVLGYLAFQCLASRGMLEQHFSLGEFLILSLAILRIIRLVAYDNIALVLREAFLDVKKVSYAEGGDEFVERVPSENSFKRTMAKLLNCPWCIGVWIAFFVLYLYLAYPGLYIVFVLLALASAASLLQVSINLIGWNAEYKKIQTGQLENHK